VVSETQTFVINCILPVLWFSLINSQSTDVMSVGYRLGYTFVDCWGPSLFAIFISFVKDKTGLFLFVCSQKMTQKTRM